MTIIVALDPGLRHPAVAVALDGQIILAERVKYPSAVSKLPLGERLVALATHTVETVSNILPAWEMPDELVYEMPQVYRASKSKGDPNDLVHLAAMAGHVAGLLGAGRLRVPTPKEWSGGLPKSETGSPWESPRGIRAAERLSAAERRVVESTHDAVDAACILLWGLGRFSARRVYPGAAE